MNTRNPPTLLSSPINRAWRWIALVAALAVIGGLALTESEAAAGGRAGSGGVVYVISQGLYYDTFVATDALPMRGRFQQIFDGMTFYGPGDPGYLGGRWWEDTNMNGVQDGGDRYFLCPLLPPGREHP